MGVERDWRLSKRAGGGGGGGRGRGAIMHSVTERGACITTVTERGLGWTERSRLAQ